MDSRVDLDEQLRQFQASLKEWKSSRERGEWVEAASERDETYEALSKLLESLAESDHELLLLNREEATVLELLARETLERADNAVGGGIGYRKLRKAIMNHDEWAFLPSKNELISS